MSSPPKFQHVSELTKPRGTSTASGPPSSETQQAWSEKLVGKRFVEGDLAATDDKVHLSRFLCRIIIIC